MAKQFLSIEPHIQKFIKKQHVFFVGSAAVNSRVNVSPKGLDAFRVLDANRVVYLDRTGSGSEAAAHLIADGRMTIMFCAFEGPPLILRLYGKGVSHLKGSIGFDAIFESHYTGDVPLGTRQIVEIAVDLVQASCGYGVPTFEYAGERTTLDEWTERKGIDGLLDYWAEKNLKSIDGLPTGFEPLLESETKRR
ncbi:MAG: pyridoxamine 5'-phosphate oxidase family protein [Aestuariivirga sp.]